MIVLLNTMSANWPYIAGQVLSVHRTEESAAEADRIYQRRVRRANGAASYIPTRIARIHSVVSAGALIAECELD